VGQTIRQPRLTQAAIARRIAAARQVDPCAVLDILPDGTVRMLPQSGLDTNDDSGDDGRKPEPWT